VVYDETLPRINKPQHPKNRGTQGNNCEDPLSKKTNDPPKRGDQVLESFVCCLPRLSVFDLFLFSHLLVSDYLLKILDFLRPSVY
jgi:hypothetical protein